VVTIVVKVVLTEPIQLLVLRSVLPVSRLVEHAWVTHLIVKHALMVMELMEVPVIFARVINFQMAVAIATIALKDLSQLLDHHSVFHAVADVNHVQH
jgi:hypothetical protein